MEKLPNKQILAVHRIVRTQLAAATTGPLRDRISPTLARKNIIKDKIRIEKMQRFRETKNGSSNTKEGHADDDEK